MDDVYPMVSCGTIGRVNLYNIFGEKFLSKFKMSVSFSRNLSYGWDIYEHSQKMGEANKPSMYKNKWLNKLRNIGTMKYFEAIKPNEIDLNMLIWKVLPVISLSEKATF